ncbi:MAG: hypothetical protein K8U57_12680 [Planctomycetes bacterium]|nr:hypothetical protein [Planctomycetota bacterium]
MTSVPTTAPAIKTAPSVALVTRPRNRVLHAIKANNAKAEQPATIRSNEARERLHAWLTRIVGEMRTVSEGMGGVADAFTAEERREMVHALEGASEFLSTVLPKTVPDELAALFSRREAGRDRG